MTELSRKGRSKKKQRQRAKREQLEGFERLSERAKRIVLEGMRKRAEEVSSIREVS